VEARKPLNVLIAGAGVAGLEAALALRALAGELVEIELLAPADHFTYKPMLVAEPFGSGGPTRLDLAPILGGAEVGHRHDALAGVDPDRAIASTAAGEQVGYDALLVALGAMPVEAVPGALTFGGPRDRVRFTELLTALGRRGARQLAFTVPPQATWSIAAYELALLTVAERDARRIAGVEISLITHERAPLGLFGPAAAELVSAKLDQAGIAVRLSATAERFEGRELHLSDGETLRFDRVIALPKLEVPEISGLPQREGGFLPTDDRMLVEDTDNVWAAGDATAFPIKQGGLAAQQAEVAAHAIAARAGAEVEVPAYRPLLRAALITGETPQYMQAPVGEPGAGTASAGPSSWSTRTKLSAVRLGPHLDAAAGRTLADALRRRLLEAEPGGTTEQARAVRTLLIAADADAAVGDFEAALAWLAVVEHLNLVLPAAYVVRRDEWRRLDPELEPDAAAKRIEGRFATAAEALSDLQRRLGWLRELEARTGGEMERQLDDFERGVADLLALSRRTGSLSYVRPGA
jgi:sulfide:quinone oxidoreductase